MSRRALILGLVLSLVAVVPLSLSACTMIPGYSSPCQCPATGRTPGTTVETGYQMSGPVASCRLIESGVSTLQIFENQTAPTPELAATSGASIAVANIHWGSHSAASIESVVSGPPSKQATLCVFLI